MTHTQAGRKQTGMGYGLRTCLLIILAALALLYVLLRGMGAFLITGDTLKKGDAVVALGGGGDWRVEEAVRLIGEQWATNLILTEPGEINPGEGPASRHFREAAITYGLSPNAIIVTEGVQGSTHDEAEAVLALMQKHNYKTVIVVTDPFHTQRTRMIFRDVFDESGRVVRVHPVPSHWYRSGTWFLSRQGWGNTMREYGKMLGFWLGWYTTLD